MNFLYKLLILSGFIFCTGGNNVTSPSIPTTKIQLKLCYSDSKHCIECFQIASVYVYTKPYEPEEYRIQMMDKLNRARSHYALANNISNMKFTTWVSGFEALTLDMAVYGTQVLGCNVIKGSPETNQNYKILTFESEIHLIRKLLSVSLREQFDNFTTQLLADPVMMTHNLNEFGCGYSYYIQETKLRTIMRCIGYIENRLNSSELKLGQVCDGCDHTSDRCIELDWYKGLCVIDRFNETVVRFLVEPPPPLVPTPIFSYQLMFRSSIYVLNAIVLILIVYVMYASCVFCRHNSVYGYNRKNDDQPVDYAVPLVENIYSEV